MKGNFNRFITQCLFPLTGTEEFPPTAHKRGSKALKSVSSCRGKSSVSEKPQTRYLEAPPINTEVDRMHLTYTKMEEVGKRYKEVRRQLKVLSFFGMFIIPLLN